MGLEEESSFRIKENPTFHHIDPKKGKIIVSDTSPVVIMKRVSLRRVGELDLPELQDFDESQVLKETQDIASNNVSANNQCDVITNYENAFVNSLTSEDLNNHIQTCLEMSSENKITSKNAFALRLIDCMQYLVQRKDLSTMACTLDAGTKIYSCRVDSLHQQVIKLAGEVITNLKEGQKNKSKEDGDTQGREIKEKRRTNKRLTIASAESLKREPVGKDPRDEFVKIEGRAGSLISNSRTDPSDLSLTIENSVPFWPHWETYMPLKALGHVILPQIKVFRDKIDNTERFFEPTQSEALTTALEKCAMEIDSVDDNSQGMSYSGSIVAEETIVSKGNIDKVDDQDENKMSVSHESGKEVNVIKTALKRMKEETDEFGVSEPPSRLKALKLLFADINDDYNYLSIKNVNYWAGPGFWKRPQKIQPNYTHTKKLTVRKKYPKEILYEFDGLEDRWKKTFKKSHSLGDKAIGNWKKYKTVLPNDLKAHLNMFLDLFHLSCTGENFNSGNKVNPTIETTLNHGSSILSTRSEEKLDHFMDTSDSQDTLNDCFYNNAPENSASSEERDQLNSCFYDAGLVPQPSSKEGRSGNVIKVEINIDKTSTDDTFLIPAPKVVSFEPIKYSARPIRVDMKNLKDTMKDIIHDEIRNCVDSGTQGSSTELKDTTPKATFSNIIKTLPKKLDRISAQEVSPAMAFLALLTLANENNLQLENDQQNDVVVKLEDNEDT